MILSRRDLVSSGPQCFVLVQPRTKVRRCGVSEQSRSRESLFWVLVGLWDGETWGVDQSLAPTRRLDDPPTMTSQHATHDPSLLLRPLLKTRELNGVQCCTMVPIQSTVHFIQESHPTCITESTFPLVIVAGAFNFRTP